ncbi:MAG: copper-translocating P-type ATPase [Anaerolineaceae bacterium]|nr:copper-translocating P-type ATPase [Anaerolineaceae bacterium]
MTEHAAHTSHRPSAHDSDAHQDDHQDDHHNHEDHSAHEGHGGHGVDHRGHEIMFRNRFWVSLLLTIPVLLFSPMIQEWFGFSMPSFTGSEYIGPIFAIIIFIYGGLPFLQMSVPEVKNRNPGMMTLISLAISVSFIYSLFALATGTGKSFFWEMATLIDVMLLGHWIEMRSVRQASGALNELAKLMPDTAERVTDDGGTEEVQVTELSQGDVVLVRPGASVPADGDIISGQSSLDEAMITGESKPVAKGEDDHVIGGTINGDGSLRVKITATGDETSLAGIMRLVEEAQNSKTQTQMLADRAASWLFYIALSVAILTAIAWIIAVGFEIDVIERVATVLVIACPHALGLAIPLVIAISTSKGANNGILVRDRAALENARNIDTVVFDKTGTLTEGRFGVSAMQLTDDWDEQRALSLALAVEGDSEHPIARGIREKAEEAGVKPVEISDFEAIKGRGIQATYDGQTVYVGGPGLLDMLDIQLNGAMDDFRQQANDDAQTVVYMIVEGAVVAAFALADVIREESQQVVDRLHEMGIEVAMLTGDSQQVAEAVARKLGIDTVFAEVLPENKDQKISELQKGGKQVAMVGDGVNDAPALTRADVGIAIGSGTDVAIESAGIILVQSNPLDVLKIFELSRATYRKMIQNLIWATAYNVIALPLAAGVLAPVGFILSPAVGAAFMSLSTIVVAINAQLLRNLDLEEAAIA